MKLFGWAVIVLLAVGLTNCKKDNNEEPAVDINKSIVINELLPKNTTFGSDQNGEFDDWIELYNLADKDIDISGYYLTDSKSNLTKWKFPEGTMLGKNGYLIIWADKDTLQAGLHTNFKLSSLGETILLLTPKMNVIEDVKYPATSLSKSYARIPNGTGDFVWSTPTFNAENK
ncbi:MAG: lamin tail domain-containing protein [Candidatus Saccharibacteria bacterium]